MTVSRALAASVALLLTATLCRAADSDVVTLTKDNFDDVVAKEKMVFVKFFAPWCGHCKSMAEDFKKSAASLKGRAVLADVDATTEEELAKKYNIEGFPTLKLFADGEEVADYSGGRDAESMIRFIEKASVPPYKEVDSPAAYDKFVADNKDKNIVIGSELTPDAFLKFKKASFALMDLMADSIVFVMAKSAAHVKIDGYAAGDIYLHLDAGAKMKKYDAAGEEALDKFIKAAALPAFNEFTQENAELYTELSQPLIVGFFKDCDGKICKTMEKVAKKNADNGKVVFAWVNSDTLSSFVEYVGLQDAAVKVCGYSFESDARYVLPEDLAAKFTEEGFEAWVADMIAGKVEQARRSQAIPDPKENIGPVYNVVGDSWEEMVEDPKKDVIIAQVAEWCGHCNALKPIYRKVAEELKNASVDHIRFCIMDATENDAPNEYKARGFPTVHFFPAGKEQKGMDFDGERTQKGIIEWLMDKTTTKFEFDVSTLGEDPQPEEEEVDDEEFDEEDNAEGEEDFEDGEEGEDVEEGEEGEEKEEL